MSDSSVTAPKVCDLLDEPEPVSTGNDAPTACGTTVSSGVVVSSAGGGSGSAHSADDQPVGSATGSSMAGAKVCDLVEEPASTSTGNDDPSTCGATVSSGVVVASSSGGSASAAAGKVEWLSEVYFSIALFCLFVCKWTV